MSRFGTLNICWQKLRQHEFPLKDGALPKGMIKMSKLSNDLTLEHLKSTFLYCLTVCLLTDSSCSAAVVSCYTVQNGSKKVKIFDSKDRNR